MTLNRAWSRPLLRKNRATLSEQLHRQFANKERRLAQRGSLQRVTLAPGDDIGRWIEDFLRPLGALAGKGAQGKRDGCHRGQPPFRERIFTGAFRRGRLLVGGLDLEGRPIGRRSSFRARDGAYAFKSAYDETLAEFSPGVMLELDNVRQLDATPGLEWMDSFAEDEHLGLDRLWPDEQPMASLTVALGAWGGVTAAVLPALRWARHRLAFG